MRDSILCAYRLVFPAGAGVFLRTVANFIKWTGVPRRCGGVPGIVTNFVHVS